MFQLSNVSREWRVWKVPKSEICKKACYTVKLGVMYYRSFTSRSHPGYITANHSCSARAKRTLFLARSARTLTHFILAMNVRNNYAANSRLPISS